MHDYNDDDQFDVYDWCDGDGDIPELSEHADTEVHQAVSPNLLQRLRYKAGPADAPKTFTLNLESAGHDRGRGEDTMVSSPRAGNALASGLTSVDGFSRLSAIARAWDDASFARLCSVAPEGAAGHNRTNESSDKADMREQMTTIVVQVKHAPLTEQTLACGAASALTARIDSTPIVAAVRRALESLYDSIGDPPPGLSDLTVVNPMRFTPAAGEVLTEPGGESEVPPHRAFPQPPGASKTALAPESNDARPSPDPFPNNPKAVPAPELDSARMLNEHLPSGSFAHSMRLYPVIDVDVVVALQRPPKLLTQEPKSENTSTDALSQLRRGIHDLGMAVNGFSQTHRAATGEIYAADPRSGDEPLVVVTGDLRTEHS